MSISTVVGARKKKSKQQEAKERNIVATLFHKNLKQWTRYYTRIDTCIPRAVQVAMLVGEPGDIVEISHKTTGMQIRTVKLKVGEKVEVNWIWDY